MDGVFGFGFVMRMGKDGEGWGMAVEVWVSCRQLGTFMVVDSWIGNQESQLK